MSAQVLIFGALNGVGIGMIYFILSVGLTMIFGLMQFVNFAHGAFYMVSAYAAFATAQWTGSVLPALIISPLLAAVFALVSERVLLQRTYSLPHESQILITFALAILPDSQRRLLVRRTPSIRLNVDGTRLRPVFTRSDWRERRASCLR